MACGRFSNLSTCSSSDNNRNQSPPPAQTTIHVKDFGAIADGVSNATVAFQKAAAFLQENGGVLIIDPGTYIVGMQKLSGSYMAGSAYIAEPILEFRKAKKPITIKGVNATLVAADGLRYGSFNPVTGEKDSIRKEGNRSSYYSAAFIFINAEACASITIEGLNLDGNSGNLNIGPSFGPEGIQLMATGIRMYNNRHVEIRDCNIHHCALDAIIVAWTGLTNSDPVYPHTIKNVKATYNGRQGLSWVGGNNLTVLNSEFSSTGRAFNKGVPVVSKPSAGIDIEIENSIIRNGRFIDCLVYDNAGAGVISIGHDTYDILFKRVNFIGTVNSAAYPKTQGLTFDSCVFVGKVERIFGSADKSKVIAFNDCLFTMDEKRSPNRKVFGDYCEFYEGQNVIFSNCEFYAGERRLPVFNNKEIEFVNCRFYQNNDHDFNASAKFKGTTEFIFKGKGKLNTAEAKFDGAVRYNNRLIKDR